MHKRGKGTVRYTPAPTKFNYLSKSSLLLGGEKILIIYTGRLTKKV
jgi:hypothetical protein